MLVLMRRRSEAIMIGEDIVIRILGLNNKQVKIGIDAPKDLIVDREEVYLKKKGIFLPGSYIDDTDDDKTIYYQSLNYLSAGEKV